jgi:hypothetical protein
MPMTGHDPRQQSLKTPPRAASSPQMQRAGCVAQRTLCGRPPVCQFTRKVSSIEEGRLWDRATTFGLLRTGPQYPFLICRYCSKSSDHDRPDTTLLYLSATRERLALRCKFRVALNDTLISCSSFRGIGKLITTASRSCSDQTRQNIRLQIRGLLGLRRGNRDGSVSTIADIS